MHPYLFDWVVQGHHLKPPTFGVLLALAFSAAYFEALRRAFKLEEDPKHIENLFLLIVISSIIGSRVFHVLFEELQYYRVHPLKVFAVWEGGYTFYGALLLSIAAIAFYCHRKKISFLQFGDISSSSGALGIFIGRLGCFFAGCCWGKQTSLPWGFTFSNPSAFTDVHDKPLHPTQLYESFGSLILFIYLLRLFKHRKYEGQVSFHFLTGYAILRFLIEFFRGDDYRGFIFGGYLSYGQFVSLLILPFAILSMILFSKRALKKG